MPTPNSTPTPVAPEPESLQRRLDAFLGAFDASDRAAVLYEAACLWAMTALSGNPDADWTVYPPESPRLTWSPAHAGAADTARVECSLTARAYTVPASTPVPRVTFDGMTNHGTADKLTRAIHPDIVTDREGAPRRIAAHACELDVTAAHAVIEAATVRRLADVAAWGLEWPAYAYDEVPGEVATLRGVTPAK